MLVAGLPLSGGVSIGLRLASGGSDVVRWLFAGVDVGLPSFSLSAAGLGAALPLPAV